MQRLTILLLLLSAAAHAAVAPNNPAKAAPRPYAVAERFDLGGNGEAGYLLVDSTAPRLFIARPDRVLVMSTLDGSLVTAIPNSSGARGIALAPSLGKGFASNSDADNVTVFDLKTLDTVSTLPVKGHHPDAILYDPASGNLYTFNGASHDVGIIDPTRGVTLATLPLGGKPASSVADSSGRIFVNVEDSAQVVEIDSYMSRRVATWALPDCTNPTGLAIDVTHQRLFSSCANGLLAVTDSSSGKAVARVEIGRGADAVVFDSERKIIVSSNGADGTLTVIHEDDPDHYSVVDTVLTAKGARAVALDPSTHRFYLATVDSSFSVLVVGN